MPTVTIGPGEGWTHGFLENGIGPNVGRESEAVTLPSGEGFVTTITANPDDPNSFVAVRAHLAKVAQPKGPQDWTHYNVAPAGPEEGLQIGYMALIDGRPSVAAGLSQDGWHYYRATTDVPSSSSDWSESRITDEPFFNNFQQGAGLTDLGGKPALVAAEEFGKPRVFIARNASPQDPNDWQPGTKRQQESITVAPASTA